MGSKFNTALDPKKTLDYALFKRVASQYMYPSETPESLKRLISDLARAREEGEDKILPPLRVIIYKDLMPDAWSWDRLLPWTSGSVLFEDYFNYLEEYFNQNVKNGPVSFDIVAAAKDCILAEEQLTTTIASHVGKVTDDPVPNDLSTKITDNARQFTDWVEGHVPIVPTACFLCITEEAKLMSSLADCIGSTVDTSLAELCKEKFEFSEQVRNAAFDILTTYKGPYARRVAASLLGMKKEATIAYGLRNDNDVVYGEEKMHISEDIRTCLLELLNIILEYFPHESPIEYWPINLDYPALTNEHEGGIISNLHLLEPSKQIRIADGSSPGNNGKIIGSPITTKSSAPRTPLSCSASSFSDDESAKYTKPDRKRKSIEQTQVSETPSMQSPEAVKVDGIADLYCSQITNADVGYPTNSSATTTPLSRYASSASAEKSGEDIEDIKKRRSIGGTKESGTPHTRSSVPWKDDGMTDQLGSQVTSEGVEPAFTPVEDKSSGSFSSIIPPVALFGAESDTAKENADDEK